MNLVEKIDAFINETSYEDYEDLDESVESAAKEIFNALFHNSISKAHDIDNFISAVLKDNGVKPSEKSKVIALVKKKGYTGDLLNEDLDEAAKTDKEKRDVQLVRLMKKMMTLGKAEESRRRRGGRTRSPQEVKLGADVETLKDKVRELNNQLGDRMILTYDEVKSYLLKNNIDF